MIEHSAKTIIMRLLVLVAITVSYSHWIVSMKRRMTSNKILSIMQAVKVKMKKTMMMKMTLIIITAIAMMILVSKNYLSFPE